MTGYPTGTITFLFTDIEGSTNLWEHHPDEMRSAVARHDALLREAVERNGGRVVKTTGDGMMAAFATAPEALTAALSAQFSLLAEPWVDVAVIRSRMGLHTGAAEFRDGDYYGPPLNRCARLMAAGHGGQTLLSDATRQLCRDALPEGVILLPMGEHRLKDLIRPETIYQVQHAALAASFPPLKTLDNPELPNNLPQQVNNFVGRESVIADVRSLLAKTRLLTLAGSGGSGKTRLSLQVAADVLDEYPDGVWFVELAPLSDPSLVPQAVASAIGLREQAGQTMTHTLGESLKSKRLLLLLDNAEHLAAGSASLVAALLRSCPLIKILVTSRAPLNIAGEQTYRVPSLSLPNAKQAAGATAESLSQFESVRLFIDRALLVKPDFAVTNANAPALAQLCFRLDGIPLAIELAAARVRSLPIEQINDRLSSRFRLLTGGDRSALPRQQTLRALIDWSYDILTDAEKMLLARLFVFAGGWTLEAAEAVCAGEAASPGAQPIEPWEMLDLLTSLADKSLILSEDFGNATAARYRMLETVRQYAREKSDDLGETSAIQERHRQWCLSLANEAAPKLVGPEQAAWLNRLEVEHDNLRSALEGYAAVAETGELPANRAYEAAISALRLCEALARFWWIRGYMIEGRAHVSRALAVRRMNDSAGDTGAGSEAVAMKKVVAGALRADGLMAWQQGDIAAAREAIKAGLTLYRDLGDKEGIASALGNLGIFAWSQNDFAAAARFYEESLVFFRELGSKANIAGILGNLGTLAMSQSDYPSARATLEESLTLYRELGDKSGMANSLMSLGIVASTEDGCKAARAYYDECLALYREIGEKRGIANSLMNLATEDWCAEDFSAARGKHRECLEIYREVGDKRGIAFTLESIASASSAEGNERRAALLRAAAVALRANIGAPLMPADQESFDKKVADARQALGDDVFAAAWDEGSTMTWEQAVEFALDGGA